MFKKKLLWQLYPTYLIITLASLLAGGWFAFDSLEKFYYERTAADLKARAELIEPQVREIFSIQNSEKLDALSKELGVSASMRITLVGTDGTVLGESHEYPSRMDNHADREE
ncbi:hypothetical protein UZ36_08045, partial [Candidatus Nitromaritima sp. SCGC AAA799-C22]